MNKINFIILKLFVMVCIVAGSLVVPASADDIRGSDQILCAALQATRCTVESGCQTSFPQNFNIPDFIEIDFGNKQMQTTKASGQNRVTPIASLTRENGVAYIQGMQGGRLFSLAVDEQTGKLTAVTASNGKAVSVFANCTPRMSQVEK